MTDWLDELEVVCGSRELAWCEARCWDECAARAELVAEHEPTLRAHLGIKDEENAG